MAGVASISTGLFVRRELVQHPVHGIVGIRQSISTVRVVVQCRRDIVPSAPHWRPIQKLGERQSPGVLEQGNVRIISNVKCGDSIDKTDDNTPLLFVH